MSVLKKKHWGVYIDLIDRLNNNGRDGGNEESEMEEELESHAEQALVLAHAYGVPWLKRRCQEAIGSRLTPATVVDALQLAALCDAPELHLRCMRLLAKEFRAVERTEAWRFLRDNDPWQELEILRHLHDADMVRPSINQPSSHVYCQVGQICSSKIEFVLVNLRVEIGAP